MASKRNELRELLVKVTEEKKVLVTTQKQQKVANKNLQEKLVNAELTSLARYMTIGEWN